MSSEVQKKKAIHKISVAIGENNNNENKQQTTTKTTKKKLGIRHCRNLNIEQAC